MDDLSLYLLDIIQNSIAARASLIEIQFVEGEKLSITIVDNGCGMSEETVRKATSPFYTTRKTRKVGLGLSLIQMLTEQTDGSFKLTSIQNQGTTLKFTLDHHHIDMPPFGNLGEMIYMISIHQDVEEFIFTYKKGERMYVYTLSEMKEFLKESIKEYSIMKALIEIINHEIEKIRGTK